MSVGLGTPLYFLNLNTIEHNIGIAVSRPDDRREESTAWQGFSKRKSAELWEPELS